MYSNCQIKQTKKNNNKTRVIQTTNTNVIFKSTAYKHFDLTSSSFNCSIPVNQGELIIDATLR